MLFTSIAALVQKGIKLSFEVQDAGNGNLDVTVVPVSKDPASNKSGVSLVAKTFTSTPAEFDEKFSDLIPTFCTATQSLQEQLDAANQMIAAAGKQASETAVKAGKPAARPTPGSAGAKASVPAKRPDPELVSTSEEGGDDDDEPSSGVDHTAAPAAEPASSGGAAGAKLELSL
jgi:PRTRC genetic system protein E